MLKFLKYGKYIVIALLVATVFYYVKYKPVRNKYIATKAVNIELVKENTRLFIQVDSLNCVIERLARKPTYDVKQYIRGVKVKHGGSLMFTPESILKTKTYRNPRDSL